MARSAIHPGEHLAEQLKEMGMSAAELARNLHVPTNRITEIVNWRHCLAPGAFLRNEPGILAESPENL